MRNYAANRLPEDIPVSLIFQGGGSRGPYAGGFAAGLLSRGGIAVEATGGVSAGLGVAATLTHSLAREKSQPGHYSRRDTIETQANMYRVVSSMNPYNYVGDKARSVVHAMDLGQRMLAAAPFAALAPKDFMATVHAFNRGMMNEFMAAHREMTRPIVMHEVAAGRKHILEAVLQEVIHDTRSINRAAAPLLIGNAIVEATNEQVFFHNRNPKNPFSLAHYAASGALTPYLPPVNVPEFGLCRDGALGGSNPSIMGFMDLKQKLMPEGKAKTVVLLTLSSAQENLSDELAARDPQIHKFFVEGQKRKEEEVAEFRRVYSPPGMRLIEVAAQLTPEQRRESLADTRYERLKGLFAAGVKHGQELADQMIDEAVASNPRLRQPAAMNAKRLQGAAL